MKCTSVKENLAINRRVRGNAIPATLKSDINVQISEIKSLEILIKSQFELQLRNVGTTQQRATLMKLFKGICDKIYLAKFYTNYQIFCSVYYT